MRSNNIGLGQHWLYNREILNEIAGLAADGTKARLCLEIGPGLGTLTSSLLRRFDKVVAVEYDAKLAQNLPKSFPGKNLEVVNGDFLEYDFDKITEPYAVAGNIPYYITSPIIQHVLTTKNLPEKAVLLMQKEVAERIADKKETMLSLFVKNRADIQLGPVVLRDEFTPPPKVDSRVIILIPHEPIAREEVFKLIALAFLAPRKKLIHNLAPLKSKEELTEIFGKLGIDLNARPADLNLEAYRRLFELCK